MSTEYLSNVACKRSSSLWFPVVFATVVFATVWNLISFRPFLPRDCLLFSLLLACSMGSYVGKV